MGLQRNAVAEHERDATAAINVGKLARHLTEAERECGGAM
jgi:hypothetical protein